MGFLTLVALIVIIWLLWTLCRNTGDALDKQTALQYEIVALEKRIEQLVERLSGAEAPVPPTSAKAVRTKSTKTGGAAATKAPPAKAGKTTAAAAPDADTADSNTSGDDGTGSIPKS